MAIPNSFGRIVKLMLLLTFFAIFVLGNPVEGRKRHQRKRRLTEVNIRDNRLNAKPIKDEEIDEKFLPSPKKHRVKSKLSRKRNRSRKGIKSNPSSEERIDVIKGNELSLMKLYQLINPSLSEGKQLVKLPLPSINDDRGTKVVRRIRLYCRAGIGYHLEIKKGGKITTNHRPTKEGILETFSMNPSVVGIRGEQSRLYLCMNKRGKLITRRRFLPDCQFRENVEKNNFNTYASELYSNHETREGFFLAISRRGKIPKRLQRVNWKQKRAHWLPRNV